MSCCSEKTANGVSYEPLVRAQIVRDYVEAFEKMTGIPVRLVSNSAPTRWSASLAQANRVCELVTRTRGGCEACLKTEVGLRKRIAQKFTPKEFCCFAGLAGVVVPVIVEGKHVATLIGGPVLARKASRRGFARLVRRLADWGG